MKKNIISLFTIMFLLFSLSACSDKSPETTTDSDTQELEINIGVSFGQNVHPFFVAMQKGIEAASKDYGIKNINILAADSSLEKQVSQIEDLIVRGSDVLLINPYDSEGVVNAINAAKDDGVKIITMDVDASNSDAFVASDNYVVGTMLAEYIIEKLDGEGNIAIIDGITVSSLKDRTEGFKETIAKSNIKIIAEQQTAHSRDTALASAENILQANPDIKAFVGINENSGMAILSATISEGLDDIILTTVDATAENMIAIRDGKVDIGVSQDPYQMGYIAVEQAIKMMNNEEVEDFVEVPVEYMDKENVKEFIDREEGYGVEVN